MMIKPLSIGSLTLLLLFYSLSLLAQQKPITGKIIDQESHQPLQGVSIAVKGTSTTVVSDNTGSFSIVVPSNNAVLEITYVGYAPQEVNLAGRSAISIGMINA